MYKRQDKGLPGAVDLCHIGKPRQGGPGPVVFLDGLPGRGHLLRGQFLAGVEIDVLFSEAGGFRRLAVINVAELLCVILAQGSGLVRKNYLLLAGGQPGQMEALAVRAKLQAVPGDGQGPQLVRAVEEKGLGQAPPGGDGFQVIDCLLYTSRCV